jgi:DNA-binding helix-hairpin-helix protein with protein kinase domain
MTINRTTPTLSELVAIYEITDAEAQEKALNDYYQRVYWHECSAEEDARRMAEMNAQIEVTQEESAQIEVTPTEAAQIKPVPKLMSWKERNAQFAAEKAAKRADSQAALEKMFGAEKWAELNKEEEQERELCPHEIEQAERNAESKEWAKNAVIANHSNRIEKAGLYRINYETGKGAFVAGYI